MTIRILLLCLLMAADLDALARTLRWTSQSDANTMDPHASSEPLTNNMNEMVYERLFARGKDAQLVPWLAVGWENPAPTKWIFHLRKGVKFQDGSPLTADDVVFSFERARQSGSTFNVYAKSAGVPRKIDDHTVEFTTPGPNPVMLETVGPIVIMSRAWCERHGVTRPQDYRGKEETHAVRNAMGSGPFILAGREVGVKTVHRRNPGWWGIKEGLFEGNLETVEYIPIANAATRLAALKSKQVDFVWDPSVQDIPGLRNDPDIRVWEGQELRVVFVGLDQHRDELLHADVKGRNPFKDRRVRLALYQAIDINALKMQVMRGLSVPTGIPLSFVTGLEPAIERRHPYDVQKARQLLSEAGYPDGFSFTLHCTTDRLINDEKICVALAAMWARVALKVKVEAIPRAIFGKKAYAREVSAFLTSYGGSTDAIFMMKPVLRSPAPGGRGDMNFGNARNDELDMLIDRIDVEMNPGERRDLIHRAVKLMQEDVHVIPLHRQVIPWASRRNVSVVHRPDNGFNPIWARVD